MDDRREGAQLSYTFGPYRLVPRQRLLTCLGVPIPLAPKLFDLLCLLVAEEGRLVTRDRITEAVWPNVFVSESNLRQKVWLLRKALKAYDGRIEYVETVPRQGYRFVAAVTRVEPGTEAGGGLPDAPGSAVHPPALGTTPPPRPARPWQRVLLGVFNVMLLTVTLSSDRPAPHVTPSPAHAAVPGDTRRSLALLRLRSHSGDPEDSWIAEAFTEMLRTEMSAYAGFRLVPAETVQRFARDLSPPPVLTLSAQSLSRVRHTLGGEWVVAGALVAAGSGQDAWLRVDLLVQCTESREIIATVTESGTRREVTELASRASRELHAALGSARARLAADRN